MKTINVAEAVELMISTKGRTFTAIFTKRTKAKVYQGGTVTEKEITRTMNCRTGVTKHLSKSADSGLKFDPIKRGLFGVYDMNNGYRFIALEGLKGLQVNGKSYIVEQSLVNA
jgi:hypothetical protein